MLIHKEGKRAVYIMTAVLTAINALMFYAHTNQIVTYTILTISVIVFLLMLNFYRKPRRIYEGDLLNYVNSPTDGKIVVIEKVYEDRFFKDERIQISIFMSFFNAHANWMPVTGNVIHSSHEKGNFHAAYLPKSSHENERSNVLIETPCNQKILTRQIAGAMARRIVTYAKEGQFYHIGDPLGFIKLGSRMDVYVPVDSEILVQLGDEVRANKTLLARLPKRQSNVNDKANS